MGRFPLFPTNHYKFSFTLYGHVADLVRFLTYDLSLVWNTGLQILFESMK